MKQQILWHSSNADPSIQRKAEELKRCKLKDDLNKKLQHRPGPLELITKKILQADAELEQAIQEGRLLFTKTTQSKVGKNETKQSEMEVISATPACAYQRKLPNVCLAKSKVRKKGSQYRTPYDQTLPSPNTRSKLKLQDSSATDYQSAESINDALVTHGVSYISDNASLLNVSEQNENTREVQSSYDLLLQQQQLFLQWQREVEESRALGISQEEEGRHCPDECATSSAASPCMTTSAQSSLVGTDCVQNGMQSVISEQMQETQQCCQCSSANFSYSGISSGTVNSVSDNEKPRIRLADYRVQDLKNECKKRQLPVSGAKPQLLERLRPYEESILNHCSGTALMDSSDLISVSSPVLDVATQSSRLPPISNVISDYAHKYSASPLVQRTQSAQQHSLVVQLPPAQQHQHQVLHLVDASGAVVATATVPHSVQCCCMSSEYPLTTNITLNGTTSQSTSIRSQQQLSTTAEVTQNVQQVQTEPTFSFAQLGSGGQFTLVRASSVEQQQASPHVMHSSQTGQQQTQLMQGTMPGNPVLSCRLPRSTNSPDQHLTGASHQVTETPSRSTQHQQTQAQIQHTETGTAARSSAVKQQNCHSQFLVCSNITRHNSKDGTTVSQNALCPPLQSAQPHCSPVTADSASGSSPDIPSPPNNSEKATVKKYPPHIDPSDTSALLSATTLSIHEEMLRFQQRKIEELQKELHRSQQQLKHQQQVILAAKKAQQAKRQEDAQLEGNQQQSEADLWLNQLDIKHLNKFHIQLFLQHKLQQQQMQAQITEQQNLTSTEEKLQEELHVEQAVQDIVRLIKQDARTALLIVQLLRRYQLERSHAVAAAAQVSEDPSCEAEVQHSMKVDSNTLEQVTVGNSQHQCVSLADIAMESIQNTSQQKTGVIVISEDELQRYVPTSTHHPKPKSRKKNNVNRLKADNTDSQEKISGSIDMEEIFKQVLENASKALMESDAEKRSKTNVVSSPSCFSEEFQIQKTISSPLRQHESGSCRIDGKSGSNPTALPSCDQLIQPYVAKTPLSSTPYSAKQMETNMTDTHFEEHVEVFEEGAVGAPQTFQYSKNQAFDDLMDVLRDDQAGANDLKSNNLDFGTGTVYGSDELATLLGDDWFRHDCAIPATSVCSQAAEQYTINSPDVLNEKTNNLDERTSNQNDPLMVSFDHNQVVDQNIGMDWLDMMLPSPSPDMDTSAIDPIQ
ncbi:SAP domain-containing protein [Loa loa]|uniref:SAP domain-containing protein n=1 Tax=Loa loa TaxID=7209 RepID=A0A1S0UK84_LOALO|nr:SAP domain-containing protein [Loa loa]EJD75778.1 SAP domain-containing protein [Loa loa]